MRHFSLCFSSLLFVSSLLAQDGSTPPATRHGTVRSITIHVHEIFEGEDLPTFYRTANQLKINTREEVVRRELLFKEGDPFDRFLVEESERNLRALPFLRQIRIETKWEGDQADISVAAQDAWTFVPQLSFNASGGKGTTSVGITESNLLGHGKRVELFFADDEGRQKVEGVWDDRRLLGSHQRLLLGQFVRTDGYRSVLFYGRPFRSLVDRDAWQVHLDFSDLVGRLFVDGDERFIFRDKHHGVDARYTVAAGNPEKLLYRISLGYSYLLEDFSEARDGDFDDVDVDPDEVSRDPAMLATDRRFSGPYVLLEQISPDYISLNYLDRFDRTEDFNLGNEFSIRPGLALERLGSHDDTLLLTASERRGYRLGERSFIRGEIGAGSRLSSEHLQNNIIFGEAKFYNVLGLLKLGDSSLGIHTLASAFRVDYSVELDRDREFLLGASNGLRGYQPRNFTGDKRVLFNVEDRFVLVEDVFRLLSIGGALFADAGGTTDDSFGDLFSHHFYGDVGVGLRFGFPRAGGGVVRFDIAFPLREDQEGNAAFEPRFVVATGQLFDARLPVEFLDPSRANVTVGLDR